MIPALAAPRLPAMAPAVVDQVRQLETAMWSAPHAPLRTHHVLHGGMYHRTIKLSAGAVITGALVKVATTLTINGDVTVFIGGDTIKLTGYNVIPASAGRKQAFVAHSDTHMTMSFATNASTVQEAEDEFTDEAHMLLSRRQPGQDVVIITGEYACQA